MHAPWTFKVFREPRAILRPAGTPASHRPGGDWFRWRFLPRLSVSSKVMCNNTSQQARWGRILTLDLEDVIERFGVAVVSDKGLVSRAPKVKSLELIPDDDEDRCTYNWHTYRVMCAEPAVITRAYFLDDTEYPLHVFDFRDHPHTLAFGDEFSFLITMDWEPPRK